MYKIDKETLKRIELEEYYNVDDFILDCKTYISAVKSGRILYEVTHVSTSGMSRNINIKSYEGKMSHGYYRSYSLMLAILGYKFAKNSYDIKVSGCGMNMLFSTNYGIIHTLKRFGFINKKTCDILSQRVN